jgi:hypothetical protein
MRRRTELMFQVVREKRMGRTYYRRCEQRKRRSNPVSTILWIDSRSLSSDAHSRDPLARNVQKNSDPLRHAQKARSSG